MSGFAIVQCPLCLAVNIAWPGEPPGPRKNRCSAHALSGRAGQGGNYHYRYSDSWRAPQHGTKPCLFPLTDSAGEIVPAYPLAEYIKATRGDFDPEELRRAILSYAASLGRLV